MLKVQNLVKNFVLGRLGFTRQSLILKAVDQVSFSIEQGEILGLVGESGCGKTTIGRLLARLEEPTSGKAYLDGEEILHQKFSSFRPIRRHVQMIFQDPFASLNPRFTVGQLIAEPIRNFGIAKTRAEVTESVTDMLAQVKIETDAINRYPFEFSGGQRQRICIARAMAVRPKLIIADEPVSALDVSIQAQILNLIKELQESSQISMLFISHDLGVVRYIADRIAVMYAGKIVEMSRKNEIFLRPKHPYTRLLLASIPRIQVRTRHKKNSKIKGGSVPNELMQPSAGCNYVSRCPISSDVCRVEMPPLSPVKDDHFVACHNHDLE